MVLFLINCHLIYFLIRPTFNLTKLTQYPFSPKCLSQYSFFNSRCLLNILIVFFSFRNPITSEIEYIWGNDKTKFIWSICIFLSIISTFFLHSHNCLIISRSGFARSPFNILNRYFEHHTKWYLHSQIESVTLLISRRYSVFI